VARIEHVLFDADGVLQDLPGGWFVAMEPYLGERSREFLLETWEEELPTLAGQGDYLPMLAARLLAYGVSTPVQTIYQAVWHNLDLIQPTFDLAKALRESGYGVHLGTNQEQHRAAYMRGDLGYDDLFDVSCYSCELGVAKPDPGFFTEAARRIGASPATILLIDDNEGNIAGARAAGLEAEHWHFDHGHPALVELLARHGVAVG